MSLATSGKPSASLAVCSISASLLQLRRQGFLALLPVAGAKLIGLQAVEHAEHLVDVAADAQVVRGRVAHDALRVDDDGGAQRDAGFRVQNAERSGERGAEEQQRVLEAFEVGVVFAP